MAGSWDFGQEPNVAVAEEEPLSCDGSQENCQSQMGKCTRDRERCTVNHGLGKIGRDLWRSPGPPRAQGCVMLCHPVGCYSELCCTVSHCKNHTFSFVFSPFFRASDDIKVLSSGFSEEERKMSAFLNSKTTRSSRGTSSLFYCIEKNTLN